MSGLIASDLLGGNMKLKERPATPMDTHDMLLDGLPAGALHYLVEHLEVLPRNASLEKAMGFSLRTFQRQKASPGSRLSAEQSGRAWKFAEILATAINVFGDRRAAEEWLDRPVMALDGRRPIDLLATPAGTAMVEQTLQRILHGVYM